MSETTMTAVVLELRRTVRHLESRVAALEVTRRARLGAARTDVLAYVASRATPLTAKDVAEALPHVPTNTLHATLSRLTSEGRLVRKGKKRQYTFEVAP